MAISSRVKSRCRRVLSTVAICGGLHGGFIRGFMIFEALQLGEK
jgi:hypothetical protein